MSEDVQQPVVRNRLRSRRPSAQLLETIAGESSERRTQLPVPGQIVAEKYRIEGLIGRGGMGAVFAATHLVTGKRVAVKWMLPAHRTAPDLADRFIREARATALIDHPNVVDIYDVGTSDGSVYLVMELLTGESLAQRLDREPITPTEAITLLMPALRAVTAAHAQGVIHRDLKPENIFLCASPDGEPRELKVFDFGISKIAADDLRDMALTVSGTVMGTPYYMSPEQIRGLKNLDARADVYAFGVILYEMLADCYPFDADTYNELILKIATTDAVPLQELKPALDPTLAAAVMRAMAREPGRRFASVAELARALEPFADGVRFLLSSTPRSAPALPALVSPPLPAPVTVPDPVTVPEPSAPEARPDGAAQVRRKPMLVGLALLALFGTLLWGIFGTRTSPPAASASSESANLSSAASFAPAPALLVHPMPPRPSVIADAAAVHAESVGATSVIAPTRAALPNSKATASRSERRRAASRPGASVREPSSTAAAAAPNTPATLPSNWDEHLSTDVPAARNRTRTTAAGAARQSVSGKLSADDL